MSQQTQFISEADCSNTLPREISSAGFLSILLAILPVHTYWNSKVKSRGQIILVKTARKVNIKSRKER